jgi:outer membrane protein assembly factor BamB
MEIAEGLELRPGAEGALPIRVRWVRLVGNIAAVAIDGDRIYVASGTLTAFSLADGSVTWEAEHPEGYALHDSGVVVIGLDGPGVVRAFAPSEYDLRVERATGRRISYREVVVGDAPAALVALPTPQPTCFRIEADLRETVAFWPDGRVAWRLVVEGPFIDALPPIDANGAIVCATSSCHLVVLDPLDRHHGHS